MNLSLNRWKSFTKARKDTFTNMPYRLILILSLLKMLGLRVLLTCQMSLLNHYINTQKILLQWVALYDQKLSTVLLIVYSFQNLKRWNSSRAQCLAKVFTMYCATTRGVTRSKPEKDLRSIKAEAPNKKKTVQNTLPIPHRKKSLATLEYDWTCRNTMDLWYPFWFQSPKRQIQSQTVPRNPGLWTRKRI